MNGGHLQDRATLGGGAGAENRDQKVGGCGAREIACGQKARNRRNKPGTDLNEWKFPEPSGRMPSP